MTVPVKDQRLDGRALATALGFKGSWIIQGIKKANAILHGQDPVKEPLIFTGRYSTPAKVARWMDEHPAFVANQVLAPVRKNSKPRGTPVHPPA